MVQPDTLKVLNDSSTILSDSLAKLDSIATADSVKAIVQIPRGFIGIAHPSLPQTESWVFAILIGLFFLLVYSLTQSVGLISDTVKTFFQVKERSSIFSKATVNDSRLHFFLTIFAIGILSFYACLLLHKPSTPFSIKEYGLFLLSTAVFFGVKSLIFDLLGYVFLNPTSIKMGKEAYFNIISFWGFAISPILLLQIYVADNLLGITLSLSLIISLSAQILITIKLFQIFSRKILASFYILLYLCTLEFLPLILLYGVFKLITQTV